jgi:hypothetical protein
MEQKFNMQTSGDKQDESVISPFNSDDMPPEIDYTGAEHGKFYQTNSILNLPADPETQVQTTQHK